MLRVCPLGSITLRFINSMETCDRIVWSLYSKLNKSKVLLVKILTSYSITHRNSVVRVGNLGSDLCKISATQRMKLDMMYAYSYKWCRIFLRAAD